MERATELEYLRFFYGEADFGPADEDVRQFIDEAFTRETGMAIPEAYEVE